MEKISRFFAFGCSYTNWPHPTWADFIGINFEEYYNYGKAGACNTYIANSFIEANNEYQFNNETDIIFIAMSGFGRFSYMANAKGTELDARIYEWETNGDTLFTNNEGHPEISKLIGNKIFNYNWAAYNSWISFITMKNILVEKKINHKIIMSINNKHYLTDFDLLDIFVLLSPGDINVSHWASGDYLFKNNVYIEDMFDKIRQNNLYLVDSHRINTVEILFYPFEYFSVICRFR